MASIHERIIEYEKQLFGQKKKRNMNNNYSFVEVGFPYSHIYGLRTICCKRIDKEEYPNGLWILILFQN